MLQACRNKFNGVIRSTFVERTVHVTFWKMPAWANDKTVSTGLKT